VDRVCVKRWGRGRRSGDLSSMSAAENPEAFATLDDKPPNRPANRSLHDDYEGIDRCRLSESSETAGYDETSSTVARPEVAPASRIGWTNRGARYARDAFILPPPPSAGPLDGRYCYPKKRIKRQKNFQAIFREDTILFFIEHLRGCCLECLVTYCILL